jgi:sugar lactone lactonase YvrE
LAVTRTGFVFVGDLPTSDGTSATATAGGILVLNSRGELVETFSGDPLNGPWDMTATENGDITTLYVTNVLNGTVENSPDVVNRGTVLRMQFLTLPDTMPELLNEKVIAGGFPERTDPAALVVGPTGVALGNNGTLYVADTNGNRIAAVPDAATRQQPVGNGGMTVSAGGALMGPLGLTLAPNGDLLAANGGNGNIVEITPSGHQVEVRTADNTSAPDGAGVLFGLTVSPFTNDLYFVDDGMNALGVFSAH